MNIQSTRIVRVQRDVVDGQPVARITVNPQWQKQAPPEFRAAGYTFPVDSDNPEDLENFAEDLELVIRRAKSKAQSIRAGQQPKIPAPSMRKQALAIGGSAALCGSVGWGLAVAAQQAGKVAQSSGNPYWNAFAIACGVAGAGLGAGATSGLFFLRRDKDGWSGQLGRSPS